MTAYGTFTYFGFLLYAALPALTLGLLGRLTKWMALGLTAVMLSLQFGLLLKLEVTVTVHQFWQLVGYALYSGAIVVGFIRWKGRPRWAVTPAVALLLLPLVVVKVVPFLGVKSMWGFLGISYVTFRSLDVLFGIQDGLIKELRVRDFWLFVLFFPTITSGPVDRYRRFMKDWEKPRTRAEYLQDLDRAVDRLFRGFLYKFIVAFLIKQYWLDRFADAHTLLGTISYMYAYSFYLFFDFAGYSAFAVGVSHLFGVRTPENFDRPFVARNIRDFWNRWHISLSTWFRDHVYMRFIMWATRRKLSTNRFMISALGFTLSMGLMGLWHGLQWHYIVYGFYHAALMIGIEYLGNWNKQQKVWGDGPLFRWAGVAVTFNVVCFGLLIFSGKLF
ncbi:MAG TPA: D-alanyl-lipoteichoic acid biosynthesis protein DltB [Symbiobacteriaceae bacterium]|nr:D-alanyl-lipoteichoic acid biosynthesis protein DltB [Symbiobacteriaceae bacterium]